MNIIVVGCGKVGGSVAGQLSEEDHNITVIDVNRSLVENISIKYDVIGLIGNAGSAKVMKQAGIEHADLLLALTGNDEINLLCCLLGRTMGTNCKTVARIKNPIYEEEIDVLKEELGLALVVNSERIAAQEIARVVRFPAAQRVDTFNKGKVELLKYKIPAESKFDGCSVADMNKKYHMDVLICAVEQADGNVVIPNGDFVLHSKDVISFATAPHRESQLLQIFGIGKTRTDSCMIIGGGGIAYYLAKQLMEMKINVTIVEKNPERCQRLAEQLEGAIIIHGDAIDESILEEEGLEQMDAVAALTNMDETNIILTLFAQKKTKAKLITKVHSLNIDSVMGNMDLDTVVCPKSVVADMVSQYVRAMGNSVGSNVETLYHLIDNRVEALEFIIKKGCPLAEKSLMDLHIKDGVIIASICRGRQVIIPNGQSVIREGDSVIVVTTRRGINDIVNILDY
jgi:trk system potassium uptake protein